MLLDVTCSIWIICCWETPGGNVHFRGCGCLLDDCGDVGSLRQCEIKKKKVMCDIH